MALFGVQVFLISCNEAVLDQDELPSSDWCPVFLKKEDKGDRGYLEEAIDKPRNGRICWQSPETRREMGDAE